MNRRFQKEKYVATTITTAFIVLISFFSAFGWIEITQRTRFTETYLCVKPVFPLPLSFPFYTSIHLITQNGYIVEHFDLKFLEAQIGRQYDDDLLIGKGFLYYSFFLLINVIGVVIGYWVEQIGLRNLYNKYKYLIYAITSYAVIYIVFRVLVLLGVV